MSACRAPDFTEALRWWKEAARRGYAVSMNNIGLLYANGQGVPQDYNEALEVVAAVGRARQRLGHEQRRRSVREWPGREQSYAEALEWYRRAAQAGDGLAMYNIGTFYENGRGVDEDLKAAYDWYNRAADKGIASAMHSLGKMLEAGRGLPADKAKRRRGSSVAQRTYYDS